MVRTCLDLGFLFILFSSCFNSPKRPPGYQKLPEVCGDSNLKTKARHLYSNHQQLRGITTIIWHCGSELKVKPAGPHTHTPSAPSCSESKSSFGWSWWLLPESMSHHGRQIEVKTNILKFFHSDASCCCWSDTKQQLCHIKASVAVGLKLLLEPHGHQGADFFLQDIFAMLLSRRLDQLLASCGDH